MNLYDEEISRPTAMGEIFIKLQLPLQVVEFLKREESMS